MSARSNSFATLVLLLTAACAPARTAAPAAELGVDNVIFMVTDGGGVAYWTAADLARDSALAVRQLPVVGLVDTQSSSSRVTDSAAGATVYATGVRTFNGAIGVGPACLEMMRRDSLAVRRDPAGCDPLESAFDVARRRGMATGVVTTTSVIDATPAAFVANSPNRYWREPIARQYTEAGLEVILGGGRRSFEEFSAPAGGTLLSQLCARADCVATGAELAAYRAGERPLVGLFAEGDMPPAGERAPTLPQMVEAALARLSRSPNGFFAVLETEGTDNSGHANEPLAQITAEMLEFDDAVRVALRFARENPRTLLIVTADHETGGMALQLRGTGSVTSPDPRQDPLEAVYTTRGHTANLVPLFAFGPGAERFGGIKNNYEVGRLLKEIVGGR